MALDPSSRWRLHSKVSLRPEPFGALAYHYGNRRLVFLRTPRMVEVVRTLGAHGSVADALHAAGVPARQHGRYLDALEALTRSDILVPEAEPARAG